MPSWKQEEKQFKRIIISLSVILVVLFFVSMCVGRYHIEVSEVFAYFTGQPVSDMSERVIRHLRIPRTLIALLVGASLAISGAIYQSAFNNKLVSPDLLGVSSGAGVGACLAILLGSGVLFINVSAFIMGVVAVLLTVTIARYIGNKSSITLILSGIAIGGLMSSLIGLMKYLADNEMKLAEMTFWLLGDVSNSTMSDVSLLMPIVAVCVIVALLMAWKLNILSLGKKESQSLGVNYRNSMLIMIVVATILTASSVSIAGTVGWVGLVIPNIVRLIFGGDNRKVLPASLLLGAIFMVIVDMMARSIAPNEIPLSVLTGLIGTPLFLYAISKGKGVTS